MVGIKGIVIPKSCSECIFYNEHHKCVITDKRLDFENAEKHKPNNCPLVEIKE